MEKFCVTFLLCDPGWCVHNSDVQNKWDGMTAHTHTHGDGDGTGAGTGVEVNEGAQDGNGGGDP